MFIIDAFKVKFNISELLVKSVLELIVTAAVPAANETLRRIEVKVLQTEFVLKERHFL